jgi:hypothetical protein
MAQTKTYVFRFDNWTHTDESVYTSLYQWCGMNEITIKYIGKSAGRRCHWLQIEVNNPLLANYIINNMSYWQLYKEQQ